MARAKKRKRLPRFSLKTVLFIVIVGSLLYGITVIVFLLQIKNTGTSQIIPRVAWNQIDISPVVNSENKDGIILHGDRNEKRIALTFDADMTPQMKRAIVLGAVKSSYDKRITETLVKTHTKATFFLTGMWIELYAGEAKQLAENPLFELGNHSYSHPSFNGTCYGLRQISDRDNIEEIGATQKLLRDLTGRENTLFRFPGGCFSLRDVETARAAGLFIVHWDAPGQDGFNPFREAVVRSVVSRTQNGSIIILHLNGAPNAPRTADALPEIIETLKGQGYEFVKISELLKL